MATQQEETKTPKKITTKVNLPDVKDFLKAGVQFGHETKRWNPKFAPYLFGSKQNIHIIDLSKTIPLLTKAGDFLADAISRGPVLFLGTKRQASNIVRDKAVEAGVHFIDTRWAGGFLTNFKQISASLNRLKDLERQFEEGVTGRTKYEISQMKKEWERLNRLYGGVKQMGQMPVAVFVVDPGFEGGPVRECNYLDIPVVAIVDTNSDPNIIDYPIPANDDAIGSISLIMDYLSARIKEAVSPHKVKHDFKDYTKVEVEIKRQNQADKQEELKAEVVSEPAATPIATKPVPGGKTRKQVAPKPAAQPEKQPAKSKKQAAEAGGILSRFQQEKEKEKVVKPRK